MAYQLSRTTLFLCKSEAVPGTEETVLSPSTHTMLLFNNMNTLNVDTRIVALQPIRSDTTKRNNLVGRQKVPLTPNSVLQNDGVAGTAPKIAPLLKSCGLAEATGVLSSSSYVQYTPVSTGIISSTCWVYNQNILHKVGSVIGNLVCDGKGGDAFNMNFTLEGTYTTPANSATMPTAAQITEPPANYALVQTESLTIAGVSNFVIRSVNFDLGNQIAERADFNSNRGYKGSAIVDRMPKLQMVIEAEQDLATLNWFTALAAGSNHDITWQHGSTPGNIVKFGINQAQINGVTYADDAGFRTFQVNWVLQNATPQNDFYIRFF